MILGGKVELVTEMETLGEAPGISEVMPEKGDTL